MTTKIFCDECEKEIQNNVVSDRVELKAGKFTFQVIISQNSIWNNGHLCFECFKKLVSECKYTEK